MVIIEQLVEGPLDKGRHVTKDLVALGGIIDCDRGYSVGSESGSVYSTDVARSEIQAPNGEVVISGTIGDTSITAGNRIRVGKVEKLGNGGSKLIILSSVRGEKRNSLEVQLQKCEKDVQNLGEKTRKCLKELFPLSYDRFGNSLFGQSDIDEKISAIIDLLEPMLEEERYPQMSQLRRRNYIDSIKKLVDDSKESQKNYNEARGRLDDGLYRDGIYFYGPVAGGTKIRIGDVDYEMEPTDVPEGNRLVYKVRNRKIVRAMEERPKKEPRLSQIIQEKAEELKARAQVGGK